MRASTIAGVVGIAAGLYTVVVVVPASIPSPFSNIFSEEERIHLQLEKQEMLISKLDSEISNYWAAIRDANIADKVTIPDSPQAYCQNPPPAASQLEKNLNSLFCSSLEAKNELEKALLPLKAQSQTAYEKRVEVANSLLLRLSSAIPSTLIALAAYAIWDRLRRREHYRHQSATPPA